MINIAVIDDDKNFCDEFKTRLLNINREFGVDCFYDVPSFIDLAGNYDIAFIDIMLNKANGIDLASELIGKNPSVKIVFISVEKDFFQDVYSAEHIYFLVKPISDEHLKKSLELCCESINKQYIYIKHKNETVAVNLDNVAYFEGMLKKTIVHYLDMSTEILGRPLSNIQDMLKNTNYIRVHQSYIINMSRIIKFTKKKVYLLDREIPISRKYSLETAKSITRFLGQKFD